MSQQIEPELSVVVPTHNRREILALTLPTLLSQDIPVDAREIIVVVDGSSDGTAELLRSFPDVRVVAQQNRGPAAARNVGFRAARGRLVLFLDDDMQCEPGHFRGHIAAHDGERTIVEGSVQVSDDSADIELARWRHRRVEAHYEQIRARRDERWPWQAIRFANTSLPRALLVESGGFDEQFRFQGEDTELGLRLAGKGAQYIYATNLVVRHVYRKSAEDVIAREQIARGRSALSLCRKHPAYRRFSALAGLRAGPWWKRWLREAGVRSPISPEPVLGLLWVATRRVGARKLAGKLLDLRSGAQFFRAAAVETGSWQTLRREFGVRLPVLVYHHVGPCSRGATPRYTVSPRRFASQMEWLGHNGYSPISCADWLAWCHEAKPLPDKPVLITFDDGYADVAEFAFPVLRQYGFAATVFIVTGLVGKTNQWDQSGGLRNLKLMTAEQIRDAIEGGIEFGSHSRSHPELTRLSRQQLENEIAGSKADLTELLGRPPAAFAYPYGCYDDLVRECVSSCFSLAMKANAGMNTLGGDPFAISRITVRGRHQGPALNWLLRFGFDPLRRLREMVRLRTRLHHAIAALAPS